MSIISRSMAKPDTHLMSVTWQDIETDNAHKITADTFIAFTVNEDNSTSTFTSNVNDVDLLNAILALSEVSLEYIAEHNTSPVELNKFLSFLYKYAEMVELVADRKEDVQ